jgi:hypothetical protein
VVRSAAGFGESIWLAPWNQVDRGDRSIHSHGANDDDWICGHNRGTPELRLYDDSWVVVWRFSGGVLGSVATHVGAGIGAFGLERINDTGHRWSLPLTGCVREALK